MPGKPIRKLLELDLKPRDIMTRQAFENAMVLVTVLGGSTNAVLHLIAIARAVGVELTIDDFQRVSDRMPLLADFKPSGRYVMEDLAGGRRHSGRNEDAAGGRAHRRQLHDGDRQNHGGESRGSSGFEGRPADRAAVEQSAQALRAHSDSQGQPGAGRRGRKDHR